MHQTCVSTFLAIICQAWRSFVFLSVPHRTTYTHPVFFHPISWTLWTLSTYLTILDLHLRSSNLQCVSPALHPVSVSISGNVENFQRNWKWFFSRYVQFDSGFHVMAINEISRNRPETIFGFRVILMWGWRKESVWFSLKNFLFFSSVSAIPD